MFVRCKFFICTSPLISFYIYIYIQSNIKEHRIRNHTMIKTSIIDIVALSTTPGSSQAVGALGSSVLELLTSSSSFSYSSSFVLKSISLDMRFEHSSDMLSRYASSIIFIFLISSEDTKLINITLTVEMFVSEGTINVRIFSSSYFENNSSYVSGMKRYS